MRVRQEVGAILVFVTVTTAASSVAAFQPNHVSPSFAGQQSSLLSTSPRRQQPTRVGGSLLQARNNRATDASKGRSSKMSNNQNGQINLLSPSEERTLLRRTAEYRALVNKLRERTTDTSLTDEQVLSQALEKLGNTESAQTIHQIVYRGRQARDTLILRNVGLVHNLASRYASPTTSNKRDTPTTTLSYEDIVQEGMIGLSKAVDKYNLAHRSNNPNKKSNKPLKLSTYATYWIRASILRAMYKHSDDLIRIPEHVSITIGKIKKASIRLGLDLGNFDNQDQEEGIHYLAGNWRTPEAERALAAEVGVTVSQLREALLVASRRQRRGRRPLEYQSYMKDVLSTEADQDTVGEADDALMENEEAATGVLSQFLQPKEMQALRLRYGLGMQPKPFRDYEAEAEADLFPSAQASTASVLISEGGTVTPVKRGRWGEAMTFAEVGKHMAVSAEYGRRLCAGALEKLRRAAEDGLLAEPDLLFLSP